MFRKFGNTVEGKKDRGWEYLVNLDPIGRGTGTINMKTKRSKLGIWILKDKKLHEYGRKARNHFTEILFVVSEFF